MPACGPGSVFSAACNTIFPVFLYPLPQVMCVADRNERQFSIEPFHGF